MKKILFKTAAATIGIFFGLTAFAQQQVSPAKEPKVSGPVLQTAPEAKAPVPPSTTDKDLHQTATKQSSFTGTVPVKAKDEAPQTKTRELPQQLPETSKLVPPNAIKNR
jgi:hypothetical protein